MSTNHRAFLWPILAVGLALIVLPFAISLPSKASAGQKLMNNFRPIMQPAAVAKTVGYDVNTFTPLRPVTINAVQAAREEPAMIGALAKAMNMTPAQVQQFFGKNYPAMANLLGNLPTMTPIFTAVPAGLDWYAPIVQTMHDNVGNFAKIDSLPDFTLFTWFFVIPGVLLVGLAGWPLLAGMRAGTRTGTGEQPLEDGTDRPRPHEGRLRGEARRLSRTHK